MKGGTKMDLKKEFDEISQEDLLMIEGGGLWQTIVNGVEGFFTNRVVWTNATYMYKNFYKPITKA